MSVELYNKIELVGRALGAPVKDPYRGRGFKAMVYTDDDEFVVCFSGYMINPYSIDEDTILKVRGTVSIEDDYEKPAIIRATGVEII